MAYRTTQKEVKATNSHVASVGYCNLQYLLQCESRYAYTCGVDGWNSDIYDLGVFAVSTGYRPFGRSVPYELCREYDEKARAVCAEIYDYEKKCAALEALIDEFKKAVCSLFRWG